MCVCVCVWQTPSYENNGKKVSFRHTLTVSTCDTHCHTRFKERILPFYLPIARGCESLGFYLSQGYKRSVNC